MLGCACAPYAKRETAAQDSGFINSLGYDMDGVVTLPAFNFLLWWCLKISVFFTFSTLIVVDHKNASSVAAVLVSTLVRVLFAFGPAPFLRTRNNVGVGFLRNNYEAG